MDQLTIEGEEGWKNLTMESEEGWKNYNTIGHIDIRGFLVLETP